VMTASEMKFILAEAYYRSGSKELARQAYSDGIRLNMEMLLNDYNTNVPAAEQMSPAIIATFINNPAVVPTAANNTINLSKIMLQKYIALYAWGVCETWVDMRRFHYVDVEAATGKQVYVDFVLPSGADLHPNNNNKPVYRTYPRYNSEFVWNLDAMRKLGADKDDFHTTELWFSKP